MKEIPGFIGYWADTSGNIYSTKGQKLRQLACFDDRGYMKVKLQLNGEGTTQKVHRLVARAFLNYDDSKYINHINGIKDDNRVSNLELVTSLENIRHAILTGLIPRGIDHPKTKLSDAELILIKELLQMGTLSQRCIAKLFGVNQVTICKINTGTLRRV